MLPTPAVAAQSTTCSPVRACWLRAWDRAKAEKLICYPNTDGSWSCKSYIVTVVGAGWSDLACNCAAGRNGRICKHASVVAKAIAVGVRPIRGTAKGGAGITPPPPVSPALGQLVATMVMGIAPSLQDLF